MRASTARLPSTRNTTRSPSASSRASRTGFGTVSKRWYDGLPAELQRAVIEEAMADQASLHEWTKNLYLEGEKVWKERTRDGWIELTGEQRAAFRQRMEGVADKVAAQIPAIKEWVDLLRAKAKQYAK